MSARRAASSSSSAAHTASSSVLPLVYERVWRPIGGRLFMGAMVPRMASEHKMALEMLDLVNHTIALSGVLAGVLFIAAEPRLTRLSLRSKNDTSVVEVARAFGGGGHRNAAGATIQEPLEAVRDAVLSELRASLARQHGAAAG